MCEGTRLNSQAGGFHAKQKHSMTAAGGKKYKRQWQVNRGEKNKFEAKLDKLCRGLENLVLFRYISNISLILRITVYLMLPSLKIAWNIPEGLDRLDTDGETLKAAARPFLHQTFTLLSLSRCQSRASLKCIARGCVPVPEFWRVANRHMGDGCFSCCRAVFLGHCCKIDPDAALLMTRGSLSEPNRRLHPLIPAAVVVQAAAAAYQLHKKGTPPPPVNHRLLAVIFLAVM